MNPGRTFYILVVWALLGVPARATGPAIITHEKDRQSCHVTYEHLDGALAGYDGRKTLPGLDNLQHEGAGHFTFDGKPVVIQNVVGASLERHSIVNVPWQEFMQRVDAESIHRIVHNRFVIQGHYVLWSSPKETPLPANVKYYFDQKYTAVSSNQKGQSYLIPVSDFIAQRELFTGTNQSGWKIPTPPFSPVVPVKPGLIVTARGTYYYFRASGAIDVYRRDGAVAFQMPAPVMAGYGSHAEILRRQGVAPEDIARDDLTNLRTGIRRNNEEIERVMGVRKVPPAIRGVYNLKMKETEEKYDKGGDNRAYATDDAFGLARDADAFLPDYLRMKPADDAFFREAPTVTGGRAVRVLRRFVYVRKPGGSPDTHPYKPLLRVMEKLKDDGDGMHLQALHGYVGNLALKLEKDGSVAGGVLAFNYDPVTHKLIRVEVDSNGSVPLSGTAEKAKLSVEELGWAAGELGKLGNGDI